MRNGPERKRRDIRSAVVPASAPLILLLSGLGALGAWVVSPRRRAPLPGGRAEGGVRVARRLPEGERGAVSALKMGRSCLGRTPMALATALLVSLGLPCESGAADAPGVSRLDLTVREMA